MNTFKMFFLVFFKRCIKNKAFIVCLLSLPIVVGWMVYTAASQEQSGITVGLYFESHFAEVENIVQNLKQNKAYTFIVQDSKETLQEKVASEELTVGYIFAEDFEEKLKSSNFNSLIEVVKYPNNLYYRFVNESVTNEVLSIASPYIAQNYLEKQGHRPDIDMINESMFTYKEDENAFGIVVEGMDAQNMPKNDNSHVISLTRGVIALYLLVISWMGSLWVDEKNTLFVPHIGKTRLAAYILSPIYVMASVAAVVSLLLVKYGLGIAYVSMLQEIFLLLYYQAMLFITTMLISYILKKEVRIVILPFLVLFVALSHPILIDMRAFMPILSYILPIFPSYHYMQFSFWLPIIGVMYTMLLVFISREKFANRNRIFS